MSEAPTVSVAPRDPGDAAAAPLGTTPTRGERQRALAVLALLTLGLFGEVLGSWWSGDDPFLLRHVMRWAPWDYLTRGDVAQQLSLRSWAPWSCVALELDLALFGTHPLAFRVHGLLAAWLCAAVTWRLLRRWTTPGWSLTGAALLLTQLPSRTAALQLADRHVVEGLLFLALALDALLVAVHTGRRRPLLLGTAAYLLALLCGEVFAPLPLLLLLLPVGRLRSRLRVALPSLVVLAAWLPWRIALLGGWELGAPTTLAQALPGFLREVAEQLLGTDPAGRTASLAALGLVATGLLVRPPARWVIPAGLGLALLPLASVAGGLGAARALLAPASWALAVGAVLVAARLAGRTRLLGVALVGIVAVAGLREGGRLAETRRAAADREAAHGRLLMEADGTGALVCDASVGFERGVLWLRAIHSDEVPPQLVLDSIDFEALELEGTTFWHFDPEAGELQDITGQVPWLVDGWRAARDERPLLARFRITGDELEFAFGPHDRGTYTLLDAGPLGRRVLPRSGRIPLARLAPLRLRVRYDAPEGWVTYSPLLELAGLPDETLSWARP